MVISDWADVAALANSYHVAPDYEHAIAMAVNADMDETMERYDADSFVTNLRKAVDDGLVSENRIKEAAQRILELKVRLDLFEHPYVNASKANDILGADTELAEQAAAESGVLLRKQGSVLPLKSSAKVVVTGPTADSVADTLGGWSIGWKGVPSGSTEKAVTVKDGLEAAGGVRASRTPPARTTRSRRSARPTSRSPCWAAARARRASTTRPTRRCRPTSRRWSRRCRPPASR